MRLSTYDKIILQTEMTVRSSVRIVHNVSLTILLPLCSRPRVVAFIRAYCI